MLFSEWYGIYYNTVAAVLTAAVAHPLSEYELRHIVERCAFGESVLNIVPALKEGRWKLLKPDGTTPLKHVPTMPLTALQKSWLMAISHDPRILLFGKETFDFPDGTYIQNFRLILDAIKKKYPLSIETENRKGYPLRQTVLPEYLEYSEKDDKFRLIGTGTRFGSTINLGRIISCERCDRLCADNWKKHNPIRPRTVIFELTDQRKALERVLLHFAHFEKQAEKLDETRYRITVTYDKEDETEVVIRILSFGPMIRVIAPKHFVGLIKQRLIDQKSCGQ